MESLMTYDEAAKYLRISKRTLQRIVARNLITHIPFPSGIVRFRKSDLDDWLEKHTVKAKK